MVWALPHLQSMRSLHGILDLLRGKVHSLHSAFCRSIIIVIIVAVVIPVTMLIMDNSNE